MTRLSFLRGATFLTLSSSFVFFNTASASSSNTSSDTTEHKTVLVTASRLNENSASSSANVTIITADEIRNSAASNLVDLLGSKAGVNTRSLYGGSKYSDIGLRGFGVNDGQNTLILLDGRRLNELDLAGVNFSSIPLDNIERIEIIRGSGSVLYGDGAVGGAINIITKSPEPGTQKAQVSAEYGSYQHRAISGSGTASNVTTSVHAYASRNLNDGYRSNNAYEQVTGALDLRHYLASAELYLKVSGDDYNIGLPGARSRNPGLGVDQLGSDRTGMTTPHDFAEEQSENVIAGSAIELAKGKQLILDWGYRHKDQRSFYSSSFGDYLVDTELKSVSFAPRFNLDLDGKGALTLGLDHYVTDYNTEAHGGFSGPLFSRYDIEVENIAYYASVEQALNAKTTVNYGARMQTVTYDAVDELGFTPLSGETFREPSYDLGLAHQFAATYGIYLHYSRAVRFVTVDEMDSWTGNFDILKPQTSNSFEFGLRTDWQGIKGRYAVYVMNLQNEIAYDPMLGDNLNLDPTQRKGIEVELGTESENGTSLDFNYSYQKSQFREGAYEGKRVPLVPAHNASLALGVPVTDMLKFSTLLNYTGRYFMDNDQLNEADRAASFTTLDFKLAARLDQANLQLALNNALDRKGYNYAIKGFAPGAFNAYPLPERNASLRVSYDF